MTGKHHGMHNTRVNHIWRQMKYRCTNPNAPEYRNYGARGITYDKRWESFQNFIEDMGVPDDKLTLERKDNNKGYSKENCYWATYKEQQNNRRNNNRLTAFGRTQTLTQWSEETGIPISTLKNRMYRSNKKKMTFEEAISAGKYDQQRGKLK